MSTPWRDWVTTEREANKFLDVVLMEKWNDRFKVHRNRNCSYWETDFTQAGVGGTQVVMSSIEMWVPPWAAKYRTQLYVTILDLGIPLEEYLDAVRFGIKIGTSLGWTLTTSSGLLNLQVDLNSGDLDSVVTAQTIVKVDGGAADVTAKTYSPSGTEYAHYWTD